MIQVNSNVIQMVYAFLGQNIVMVFLIVMMVQMKSIAIIVKEKCFYALQPKLVSQHPIIVMAILIVMMGMMK